MKVLCGFALVVSLAASVSAQTATATRPATAPAAPASIANAVPPADYTIGPDDVLAIVFWRDKDMSAEVTVRPDGRITLPLLNEVPAAGLTLEQLRQNIKTAAEKFVDDPSVTVDVKQINSRKVFITGEVGKPGPYALMGPTTVMQLLSMAGGVNEYAKADNISILRTENGKQVSMRFNYKDVINRKNLKQNIELKPGDTVVVP